MRFGCICLVLAEYILRVDLSCFFIALVRDLLCLFRINAARPVGVVRKRFGTAHLVMVVGSGERARALGDARERSEDYGIRLVGFLADLRSRIELSQVFEVYPLSRLQELLRQHVIDEIIFAVDSASILDMEDMFLRCDDKGVRTRFVADFFPRKQPSLSGSARHHTSIDVLGRTAR
jgi:FlaA1/EpsC-like NDP-sugar epimerase